LVHALCPKIGVEAKEVRAPASVGPRAPLRERIAKAAKARR
jgi:hypothetical protein